MCLLPTRAATSSIWLWLSPGSGARRPESMRAAVEATETKVTEVVRSAYSSARAARAGQATVERWAAA